MKRNCLRTKISQYCTVQSIVLPSARKERRHHYSSEAPSSAGRARCARGHSRICTDCGLVCSSRQAILITKVSGFVLGCWVVFFFFNFFFWGFLLITFSPSYHQTQLVRNSDRELPIFWMSSLKLLETTAFIPTKPVLFLRKEVSFLCDVTVVDVPQCNHMFVKLFVPCKLMNQTILGFQSAFVSKNIFASIEM